MSLEDLPSPAPPEWFIDVREKRIRVPESRDVGSLARAWASSLDSQLGLHMEDELPWFAQHIQALINSVHDEVMLKVERAFAEENRKAREKE